LEKNNSIDSIDTITPIDSIDTQCYNSPRASARAGISLNSPGDSKSPGEFKLIPALAEHEPLLVISIANTAWFLNKEGS
jgi:hypothetical protein